jgi:hypothetical protein
MRPGRTAASEPVKNAPSAGREADASRSLEDEARHYVQQLKGLYGHAAAYVIVNALLVAINLMTAPGTFWAIWPILGWGVKLALHAYHVFGPLGPGTSAWEEQAVQRYMQRRRFGASSAEGAGRSRSATDVDPERIVRRLEHLEAIVTQEDWTPPPSESSGQDV